MASDNPTWGAPRIHGELLKLGFDVSKRTVSRYLERIRPEPRRTGSQTWSTFLRNQAKGIVAVDLFTVPTVRFQVLYVFVVLALERRRLVFANVTTNPTAFWLSQQTINSFPWDTAPRFLIRDRDKAYGNEFSRRVRSLGIRSIKTAVRAPRMNCYVEHFLGTVRRELFDHVIMSNESHARRLLREFQVWYNEDRLRLALDKDAPDHRPVEPPEMGDVFSSPRLGGLHHRLLAPRSLSCLGMSAAAQWRLCDVVAPSPDAESSLVVHEDRGKPQVAEPSVSIGKASCQPRRGRS
jgi:transposase InsO family protein